MAVKTPTYDRCASCSALNMAHRTNCYRCGRELPLTSESGAPRNQHVPEVSNEFPKGDRRQSRRHVVCLKGGALTEFGDFVEITIRNIGYGGLLFDCARQFNIEDKLTLRIETPAGTFTTGAVVKHIGGLLSHETPFACGVEITEPGDDLLDWIAELDEFEPEPWAR